MSIKSNTHEVNRDSLLINMKKLKKELKEHKETSSCLTMIKKCHNELINMGDSSFAELMNFEYNVSSFDEFHEIEVNNDFGYFIWKKLNEKKIKSLNSLGIPDTTLEQLVKNKTPVWELQIKQVKVLIEAMAIDIKEFINAVSNFDLTIVHTNYNKNLLARLDSSAVNSRNDRSDLIEEGSYNLFIARQERKREKFLKECKNLLY